MRRLLLFFTLATFLFLQIQPVSDQSVGKMDVVWAKTKLPKGSTFGVKFDYSRTLFRGLSYDDFCHRDAEFGDGMKEAEDRFYRKLKEKLWDNYAAKKRVLSATEEDTPDYTIFVRPRDIDEHGNFIGDVVILDAHGKPFANMRNVFGAGGHIGSYTNLIGDGYESVVDVIINELALAIDLGKA